MRHAFPALFALLLGTSLNLAAAEFEANPCDLQDAYSSLEGQEMVEAAEDGHVSAQYNLD